MKQTMNYRVCESSEAQWARPLLEPGSERDTSTLPGLHDRGFPEAKVSAAFSPIFAVVIAKPGNKVVYTEELKECSAVALLFPGLVIG